jgi:ABC-type branched-subunit amino acid transport system substrate-binding protein
MAGPAEGPAPAPAPAVPAAPAAAEPVAPGTLAPRAEGPRYGETKTAPSAAAPQARYADTPEELEPFHKFKEPYKRFFLEPLEANGPGRDLPEPDVKTVKIGLLAPLERTHESYMGRHMAQAVKMAIEDANASGGYKGKPFELIARNDNGLWGASANEIARFGYEDNVWAIIGSVDSANTHIAIRVGLKIEIPIITPADTDPTYSETRIPWAFRNIPDDRQMTYTIATYVFKELGLNRVAIFRANNRFGRFGVGEFRQGAVRFGKPAPIEINYEVSYENVNPDFTTQLERIEKTQPEGLVLWADAQAAGAIVRAIRGKGYKMPIFACERVVNPDFLKIAGPAAEGVIAVYPYNPDRGDPLYDDFAGRYEAKYGEKPLAYASYSYDSTMMLVAAIRKAGLNRWKIRDALQDMPVYKGVTGETHMDLTLTNRAHLVFCTVKDGKFVYDEPKAKKVW